MRAIFYRLLDARQRLARRALDDLRIQLQARVRNSLWPRCVSSPAFVDLPAIRVGHVVTRVDLLRLVQGLERLVVWCCCA